MYHKNKVLNCIEIRTSLESRKKLRIRTLILNFFFHNQNLKVPIEKVWKYGFIKKDKFELNLRMTNETIKKLLL